MGASQTLHQLRVALDHVAPPVWRRIVVPSAVRLDELHAVLQVAMGWTDSHLHMFEAGRRRWEMDADDDEMVGQDERTATLAEVAPKPKARLRYDYDFGDGWSHTIVVESVEPAPPGKLRARCLAGARACPPEDCGGPHGYADMLAALADPRHPDHEDVARWMEPAFDPERFDCARVDAALSKRRFDRRPPRALRANATRASAPDQATDDTIISQGLEALVDHLGPDGPDLFFGALQRSAARLALAPPPARRGKKR